MRAHPGRTCDVRRRMLMFMYLDKMEKSEFRAVIKHLYSKGLTPKKPIAELDEVHGKSAPVFATVYNWVNEYKRGRKSTKDEHHSRRLVEVITSEMIDKIHDMVLSDRRCITVDETWIYHYTPDKGTVKTVGF